MNHYIDQTKLIVELLSQTTSLAIVRDFLKSKQLKSSASSWEAMLNTRIIPLIETGELGNEHLIELLRSAEEHGHQHVFLFMCPEDTAAELLDRNRVRRVLSMHGTDNLLDAPIVLGQPEQPTLADVRWSTSGIDVALTVKEIELRTFTRYVGIENHGSKFHKVYEHVRQRAVNVAKLHRDGLLEIRVASLENSTKYEQNIRRFWSAIEHIFPQLDFVELSLSIAKNRIWAERDILGDLIRYNNSTIRDEHGNILRAATGSDDRDLGENEAVSKSLDYFLENDTGAYCDGSNITFKCNDELSTDTRVILAGEPNEFGLTANCTAFDYDYVLGKIRSFNQRVS